MQHGCITASSDGAFVLYPGGVDHTLKELSSLREQQEKQLQQEERFAAVRRRVSFMPAPFSLTSFNSCVPVTCTCTATAGRVSPRGEGEGGSRAPEEEASAKRESEGRGIESSALHEMSLCPSQGHQGGGKEGGAEERGPGGTAEETTGLL